MKIRQDIVAGAVKTAYGQFAAGAFHQGSNLNGESDGRCVHTPTNLILKISADNLFAKLDGVFRRLVEIGVSDEKAIGALLHEVFHFVYDQGYGPTPYTYSLDIRHHAVSALRGAAALGLDTDASAVGSRWTIQFQVHPTRAQSGEVFERHGALGIFDESTIAPIYETGNRGVLGCVAEVPAEHSQRFLAFAPHSQVHSDLAQSRQNSFRRCAESAAADYNRRGFSG
jgi:hypothetical protein